MPRVNVQEAVNRFRERLETDYYPAERSKNNEEDYSAAKETRDTSAVHDFVGTACFQYIKNME